MLSGQESAGIVMGHGDNAHKFDQHRKMGLVTNVFSKEVLMKLKGNLGIGNTLMFFIDVSCQLRGSFHK